MMICFIRSVRGGLAFFLFTMAAATPAAALDTFFASPRAMGMGGANVASVQDSTAQYYNPAAFGFFGCQDGNGNRIACDNNDLGRKEWGVDLSAAAGYRLLNEFGTFVDELQDLDLDRLSSAGIQSESDLTDLIRLVRDLDGLDDPGNAILADANAGLGIRVGHFGIGGRAFFQASGQVIEIDRQNLGISATTDLNAEINAVTPTGFDNQILLFSADQQAQLMAAGLDAAAISRLDYMARQEGVEVQQTQDVTDLLETITEQTSGIASGGDLSDNMTTVLLQGFAAAEIPVTYGYALNDHWSIGGNLKAMRGRVYGNQIIVFDDDADEVLRETDEKYEETTTFGIDLGIMGRYRYINIGLVGRNLNSPKFDGFSDTILLSNGSSVPIEVDDVTLDPQVTAGVAIFPYSNLVLETSLDLTENDSVLPGYQSRNLSLGAEWDVLRFLALRAGAYKNLAESDIGWVYTAGLGFNLWAARLDVAGAFSGEQEEFDGDDIPSETRLAAQFSVDF